MTPLTKHIAKSILLALFSISGVLATAAESPSAFECKPDGNQQEMNACAFRDHQVADQALNAKYKEVLAALSPSEKQKLRQEQRAWLKKLAPKCVAAAKASEGGSIWALEYYGCTRIETERRTKQLANWRPNR